MIYTAGVTDRILFTFTRLEGDTMERVVSIGRTPAERDGGKEAVANSRD